MSSNCEQLLYRFKGETLDIILFKSEGRMSKIVRITKYEPFEKYAKTYATQSTPLNFWDTAVDGGK